MSIHLAIKGQRLSLDHAEVNDLLRSLEFALGGGNGERQFGCVTASCDGRAAAQGSKGAGGAMHFSEREPVHVRVARTLGRPLPDGYSSADNAESEIPAHYLADC
jgi:hypothetical protein